MRDQAVGVKAEPNPVRHLPDEHELKYRMMRFIIVCNIHNKESVYLNQRRE